MTPPRKPKTGDDVAGGPDAPAVTLNGALLLDKVQSCRIEAPGRELIAVLLEGRMNRDVRRRTVTVIVEGPEALAGLVKHLAERAAVMGPDFALRFHAALDD
jgi:hypothetical protein